MFNVNKYRDMFRYPRIKYIILSHHNFYFNGSVTPAFMYVAVVEHYCNIVSTYFGNHTETK